MLKIKKSTFTTDEHEDFTQERSASITKGYVTLFPYMDDNESTPETGNGLHPKLDFKKR